MSATNITSKCRMASIELDDAMILPHAANLDGSNFRKGQDCFSRRRASMMSRRSRRAGLRLVHSNDCRALVYPLTRASQHQKGKDYGELAKSQDIDPQPHRHDGAPYS